MSNTMFELRDRINQFVTTDKGDDYIESFEEFFSGIRNKEDLNFLEIGIFNGASLLLWAEYFKHGRIYGIDLKEKLPDEFDKYVKDRKLENSITTFLETEIPTLKMPLKNRETFFKSFLKDIEFDVILDDGAHTYTHTKAAFDVLFNDYLKPGGIYILEDWGTTYFPGWPDGSKKGEKGMAKIIKELYDEVALIDRLKGQNVKELENYKSKIKSITIRFGQIWIFKNK